MNCENIIVVGDFSLALDMENDKRNVVYNNGNTCQCLKDCMNDYTLADIWRIKNPEKFSFPWKRNRSFARLDYFIIPAGLIGLVEIIDIPPGFKSDHSVIQIVIKFENVERGPSYWKFNNTLLAKPAFVDKLKILADEIITLNPINGVNTLDRIWELLKYEISKYCTEQTLYISKEKIKTISNLQQHLKAVEDDIVNTLENNSAEIQQVKNGINNFYEGKTKSSMFRCKAIWYGEGEKSSKYFFSLEKLRYNQRAMVCFVNPDGSISRKQKEILSRQSQFYQNL